MCRQVSREIKRKMWEKDAAQAKARSDATTDKQKAKKRKAAGVMPPAADCVWEGGSEEPLLGLGGGGGYLKKLRATPLQAVVAVQ